MILIDTHVAIWLADETEKLSEVAAETLRTRGAQEGIAIAGITLFEVAWLIHRGKVQFPGTMDSVLSEMSARHVVVPLNAQIAALAAQFPSEFPGDPVDRIIGATALSLGATLVTKDEKMRRYPRLQTIW